MKLVNTDGMAFIGPGSQWPGRTDRVMRVRDRMGCLEIWPLVPCWGAA